MWAAGEQSSRGRKMCRSITGFIWLTAVIGVGACNTPQIPLPPPLVDDIAFALTAPGSTQGQVSGTVPTVAGIQTLTVRVINFRDKHGVIAPADLSTGAFQTKPFEIQDGDRLDLNYTTEFESSETLCVSTSYTQGFTKITCSQ